MCLLPGSVIRSAGPERNVVFTEVNGVNHQAACEEPQLEVTSAWMLAVCFLGPAR